MNNNELMNALALASKAKTNKELVIMAGLGILVIGGICYYYHAQNQELKRMHRKSTGQMSEMGSQIYSLQEIINRLHAANNQLYLRNKLIESMKKSDANISIKEDEDRSS